MHIYIYDDFVSGKKYDGIRNRLETRITDLGLAGRIIRLGLMKDTLGMIEQEINRGAKTIVAVGNDKIVNQTLNSLLFAAKNNSRLNIPLGIIPIGEKNNGIARSLGINSTDEACDIISARRIEKLDVGKISEVGEKAERAKEKFFVSQIAMSSKDTMIEIDKKFMIEAKPDGIFVISNLPEALDEKTELLSNPQDGKLELFVKTPFGKKKFFKPKFFKTESSFPFDNLTINSNKDLIFNNTFKFVAPVKISILKKKINIIVGKERFF